MICQKPVAQSLAYQGELEYILTNPITGEKQIRVISGHMCPPCNQACGYRTHKKKLEKYLEKE